MIMDLVCLGRLALYYMLSVSGTKGYWRSCVSSSGYSCLVYNIALRDLCDVFITEFRKELLVCITAEVEQQCVALRFSLRLTLSLSVSY
jgi:hypothetical protein